MSREELVHRLVAEVRAGQVATDLLDEAVADAMGLNRTDARALDVIDQKGRITAGDLARELRLTTGAVTTVIDRLERRGLARRVSDPGDRRRVLVEVTQEANRSIAAEVYGASSEAIDEFAGYTDDELELLIEFTRRGRIWTEGRIERLAELMRRRDPGG